MPKTGKKANKKNVPWNVQKDHVPNPLYGTMTVWIAKDMHRRMETVIDRMHLRGNVLTKSSITRVALEEFVQKLESDLDADDRVQQYMKASEVV